jgi:RimJ/RimL family protein N-acetyltransferase
MRAKITFKKLSLDDCACLHRWLQLAHVRLFWDDGHRSLQQVQEYYWRDDSIKRYLFFIDDKPAGYIQSYVIARAHEYGKFSLPDGKTLGVDYFIGNEDFLGKGWALFILKRFISFRCKGIERVIVDPEPENKKAIHIYEKCGFKKIGEQIIKNKRYCMMALAASTP